MGIYWYPLRHVSYRTDSIVHIKYGDLLENGRSFSSGHRISCLLSGGSFGSARSLNFSLYCNETKNLYLILDIEGTLKEICNSDKLCDFKITDHRHYPDIVQLSSHKLIRGTDGFTSFIDTNNKPINLVTLL